MIGEELSRNSMVKADSDNRLKEKDEQLNPLGDVTEHTDRLNKE